MIKLSYKVRQLLNGYKSGEKSTDYVVYALSKYIGLDKSRSKRPVTLLMEASGSSSLCYLDVAYNWDVGVCTQDYKDFYYKKEISAKLCPDSTPLDIGTRKVKKVRVLV